MKGYKLSQGFGLSNVLTVVLLIFGQVNFVNAQQSSIKIDRSGQYGQDASNGSDNNPNSGASSGAGRDGGDAGRSTSGADGKSLKTFINDISEGQRALIKIQAEVQGGSDLGSTVVNLTSNSSIQIDVSGGKGGDGGRGGDGQGGCNGTKGRAATKSSRGGNGTNGCPGGDAGRGSPGSDGGDSGNATIYIPVEDVHLSILTYCQANGGAGGSAGQHGRPGEGGRGGDGGSSYYNSYRVPDGKTCTSHRVNNGNGSYSTQTSCSQNYRTEVDSNPGGSDGSRGSDGNRASGDTSAGQRGRNGVCIYVAQDGKKTYQGDTPFLAKVQSYTLVDENKDGILEPDETIYVRNIKIKNWGDLPTPTKKAVFKIYFSSTRYTTASEFSLELPRLNPGETHTFDKQLSFKIRSNSELGLNERLVLELGVTPSNHVSRIDRAQPGFENVRNILITYPIEISAFSTADSVGAGQKIPIFWKVRNVSGRDFGGDSEMQRSIKTALSKSGGDAKSNTIKFISKSGEGHLLTKSLWTEILSLKSRQEKIIEGFLEISPEALAYTQHQLTSDLQIQNFLGDEQIIQSNLISLRISQLYNYNPKSEFLLITNKQTERNEFLAWKKLAESMGTSVDVWDLSYYGRLSFNNALEELSGKALSEVLKNKTIIALNNDQNISNRQKLSISETVNLLSKQKANFLVLGGRKNELVDLYKEIMSVPLNNYTTPSVGKIDVMKKYMRLAFWSKPSKEDFIEEVSLRSSELLKKDPKSRFYIMSEYSPKQVEGSSYSLGSINYFRTLSPGDGRAVFLPYEREELHRSDVVLSDEFYRAVILPTSFVFKLNALKSNKVAFNAEMISDSILYDLILEMDLADIVCESSECSLDLISKSYQFISQIGKYPSIDEIQILAGLNLYIDELDSKDLRNNLDQMFSEFFDIDGIKVIAKTLRVEAKTRKKSLPGITDRKNIRNMLTLPAVHRAITTDTLIRLGNVNLGEQN